MIETHMSDKRNIKGFSLIELLIVILLINVLGAISITVYVGIKDKARRSTVTRLASSVQSDLQHWLKSSISPNQNLREIDTNFNGTVDGGDSTNGALNGNVTTLYTNGRNTIMGEISPWFNIPLWSLNNPPVPGTISVTQPSPNQLNVVAADNKGQIIVNYIVTVD